MIAGFRIMNKSNFNMQLLPRAQPRRLCVSRL